MTPDEVSTFEGHVQALEAWILAQQEKPEPEPEPE
jgi:hypothetical protein